MTRPEPGLEFLPHLTLLRPIGRGGMGEVWIARDATRGEDVVAKILPADAPEERVALLRREARLVRKLKHPGIVPVYAFERGPHGSAVLLRHMKGGDAGRLRGAPPLQVVRLAREVAEALAHLHGLGVVHRDVKPTNVLLDEAGHAHISDFGIAAVAAPIDDERLTLHGGGSRASMSPQQRAGEAATPADDVYALGALLYELVSGRPPFSADATDDEVGTEPPPLEPPHSIPPRLHSLIASMLARDPVERPRDMRVVEEVLRAIGIELSGPHGAASPVAEVRNPHPRVPDARVVAPPVGPAASDVRLHPPPRVPDVGPAPPVRSATPAAGGEPSRPRSWPQAVLLGSLAFAAVFVVLVLPRFAKTPASSTPSTREAPEAPGPDAATPAAALSGVSPEAPAAGAAPPPLPSEATPPPREALPTPAEPPRLPRGPRPREAPAGDAAAEEVARRAMEFRAAMSGAQAALARGDWAAARQGITRAAALAPGSPAVADARRRIEEGERTAALARQREAARAMEAREDWRRALAEYEAALKLDPAVAFALEGRRRTASRASLAEKLDYHIAHPLRLATDAVAAEAERLLQQAREIEAPGPRHRRQVASLEQALARVRTPVPVVLESDEKTDVVVHKVGRLGTFARKVLELRPGTYTVVGTRSGFRDVRRQLVVEPNGPPSPLVVRCEEEI
jgi:hypothetical protein